MGKIANECKGVAFLVNKELYIREDFAKQFDASDKIVVGNALLSWNKLSKESFKSFFIHSDFSGDIYCFTNEDIFMHNLKQLFDIETNNGYLNNRHKEISTPTHYIMILE